MPASVASWLPARAKTGEPLSPPSEFGIHQGLAEFDETAARLEHVDAPEANQPLGPAARAADLVEHRSDHELGAEVLARNRELARDGQLL
jgi:hypothetical protein